MSFAPVLQVKALAKLKWESRFFPDGDINRELVIVDKKWFETKKSGCIVKNGVEGYVSDATTNLPLKKVSIKAVNKDNAGESYSAQSDSAGKYKLLLPTGTYNISYTISGYKTVVLNNVKIEEEQITYNPKLEIIKNDQYGKTGIVGGVITNAQTGRVVSGANISIYQGLNISTGHKFKTITTGADGKYKLELPTGHYTAVMEKSGYIKNSIILVSLPNKEKLDFNGTITPNLSSEDIRIVLSWGEEPEDLDSHLLAPTEDGEDQYEIYWDNDTYYSADDTLMTELDVDDTDSFGPETITIKKQVPGTYTYSIWDYTNRRISESDQLSNSGAKVDVYMGTSLVKTFFVPVNKKGNKWNVFKLEGKTITPINTLE
ncbi:carboxypeptidase regulatory-like domain-containing protein [Neobacillus drentensis]